MPILCNVGDAASLMKSCFLLQRNLYRSFHKGDIVSSSRVIVGVDAAIADAASLALMVESVGQGTDQWKVAAKRYK